jgi:nitrogen regulatory protein PII
MDSNDMNKIEAIFALHLMDPVRSALRRIGADILTTTEIKGVARRDDECGPTGDAYRIDFTPMAKLEAVLSPPLVDAAVATIMRISGNGRFAQIFISSLDDAAQHRRRGGHLKPPPPEVSLAD